MSELIAMRVQEEERLKVEKSDVVHVSTNNSNKIKGSWKGKGKCNEPESFEDAITCDQSAHWREAMEDELNSMSKNNVWKLAELPKGAKLVGCKWVYKTKLEPNGNVERYKALLVAKGYTQKEGIDYKDTFSPVSRKDSLRIVMSLVAHFNLELHQIDVKMAFLNGDLHEDVYMAKPQAALVIKSDVFGSHQCLKIEVEYEEMRRIPYAYVVGSLTYAQVCTQPDIAYIYGMLGRFRSNPDLFQWKAPKKVLRYLQGTKEYKLTYTRSDNLEVIGYSNSDIVKCKDTSKSTLGYIFMLSDDILLASNNIDLLHESKRFQSRNFDMKDLGEALYVIGIEIHRD
nr:putative zinc finger, CCHC-type [Tanacetum cinerariifolium]